MDTEDYCGMDLFTDFTFEDLTKANPPQEKGVYVIKIKKRGLPPDEIISQLMTHIAGLHWEMVQTYLTSRIARINNITECPVIYAYPSRLDLTDTGCIIAREHGAKFAIGSDAHRKEGLRAISLGVATARRGWLAAGDVINTRPLAELQRMPGAKEKRREGDPHQNPRKGDSPQ